MPSISDIVPSFRLDGRVAVVTGGSGGMAAVLNKALLAQGASVALVDIDQAIVDKAGVELTNWATYNNVELITNDVQKISSWECDVTNYDQITQVLDKISGFHKSVPDLLVHTAGFCNNFDALEYPPDKMKSLIEVNLLGSLYFPQVMAKLLVKASKPGSFILIGSMSGVIVNYPQNQVAYNASKAGVIHAVRSLATEWAKYNIRVNCLSPGYILTPLTKKVIGENVEIKNAWESRIPMNRMADPKEFVGSILYLANHDASSYTTGENLVVDGGYQCW
ncbi:NAD(P)-binding protein [Ascoidea rubescens DSM 1968]|uniref:D-arabinitol 2-dehydrogenase [ribulose-forming] n=1 Tax=Ascoidea rubescens DSM 1968 TaxID=1344418 RepID=A0A1D2VGQ1_9ASCO|nr:NAD(P)-binding protein [Ascoidea rubescens DSM 1968]ODV60657.1 NAD(P)-binding protein [Ascoidea rubescens DSM 1968]